MTDPLFSDKGFQAGYFALNGLSRRQEIIGRNLSNVDTPGYQAENVTFEDSLRSALGRSERLKAKTTHPVHLTAAQQQASLQISPRQGGSWRADGNNVDIDVELNQLAETAIRYQAITQLVSKKFQVLKSILGPR